MDYHCVILHKSMAPYEVKKLEIDIKQFVSRNFEKPSACKNLEQVRFYVKELCAKIDEFERQFKHVPECAYALLAQYNARQNSLLHSDFERVYS
jgi:SMC interacting uncharacterized protein involved in chromosome segregation